jgi:uncharacterized MAPEG superfamily protein
MHPPIYWFAICAIVLFLKMFGLSLYQGYHRISRMTFRTPEDARFVGRTPAAEELPEVQRAAKAWLNDVENIPVFLALGLVYVLVGASPAAAPWLFGVFTGARILHTLSYLAGLQPWRTLFYAVAIGCLLWMCVNVLAVLP